MPLNRFFLLTLGTSLCVLSACTTGNTPQWFPKGYVYQDTTPISSPAPSTPWDNDAKISDTENMSSNAAAWQGAVYELVAAMEPNLPKDGTPLNLSTDSNSAHNTALDHYLRQALMAKGYNLTTLPKTGTMVISAAEETKTKGSYLLKTSVKDVKGKVTSKSAVTAVLPFEDK